MALSQMGIPGNTSGSGGVYLSSADSVITEINTIVLDRNTGLSRLTVVELQW